jgi:sarcosine oxidase
MALLARAGWRDLEAATGRQLLHVTGQVTFGDDSALHGIALALATAAAPVEEMSAAAAVRRYPGIAPTGPVLVEPESGVLAADECLRALHQAGGFEVQTNTRVTSLHQSPDGVTVETASGAALDADIVVVTAGPASLGLAGFDSPVAAPPSLPQVAYFAARDNEGAPPVFIEWGDDMLYGLPVPGGGPHAGTYKVAHHTPGPDLQDFDPIDAAPIVPDPIERAPIDPATFDAADPVLLERLTDAVTRLLPSLHPEPVATERCVYDNSADTDFILDRVGRVVVGCGTSGHAFKFGPLLGDLLADLAEERRPAVELARFSLRRTPTSPDGTPPALG